MTSITNENHAIWRTTENRHLNAAISPLDRTPKRAQSMRCPRIKQTDDVLDVGNNDTIKLMPLARNSSVRRSRPSDDETTTGIDPTFYTHSPGAKSDDGASSDQADEMQRMRTFQVNSKGAIVERGESMRRRGNSGSHQNGGGVAPPKSPNTVAATSPSVDFKQPCQKFNFDLHPVDVPAVNVQKCDIIIIGSSEVGKASILKQLVAANNVFGRDSDLIPTNVSYSNQQQNHMVAVSVNKEEFEVTFFTVDPNKNDLWQSLCASGYIVVFAVNDSDSFKCARECVYKLRDSKFTENVPIILAANKIDLERKRHVSNDGQFQTYRRRIASTTASYFNKNNDELFVDDYHRRLSINGDTEIPAPKTIISPNLWSQANFHGQKSIDSPVNIPMSQNFQESSINDAKTVAKSNGCKFVELSTVLCHNVDELLVALLTKIKKQTASIASTNKSVVNRADSSRAILSYRSSNPATDVESGAENSDIGGSRNGIFRRSFRKSRHHQNPEDDNEHPSFSHTSASIGSPMVQAAKPKLKATKSAQPHITLCDQNKNEQNNVVHHFGEASRQFLRKIFSGKRVQSRSAEDVSNG